MAFSSLLPIQYSTSVNGFGVSPRQILEMNTQYGKIIKLHLEENKVISGRLVPVPASFHMNSGICLPNSYKRMYNIETNAAIATIIEPDFLPSLEVQELDATEYKKLPMMGSWFLDDKTVVFPGMIFRHKLNKVYRVIATDEENHPGIIFSKTKILEVDNNNNNTKAPENLEDILSETKPLMDPSSENDAGSDSLIGRPDTLTFEHIHKFKGIDQVLDEIKQDVLKPFHELLNQPIAKRKNIGGTLFYGPPGCGKTKLSEAMAKDLGIKFLYVKLGDLASSYIHQFGKNLAKKFKEAAEKKEGALLFLDEFDAMAGNRKNHEHSHQTEEVNILLQMLDPTNLPAHVLVVAATNLLSNLDPAVIRSGRFDTKIAVLPPDATGRKEILRQKILDNQSEIDEVAEELTEDFLDELANNIQGFVGADIETLVKKSIQKAKAEGRESGGKRVLQPYHFEQSVNSVLPLSDTMLKIKKPTITKEELPGSEKYIDHITIEINTLLHPESFRTDIKYTPQRGFLLHGPPGTGKTSIANAVANSSGILFKVIKSDELDSKYVGETQKNIREVFENARLFQPILLFFDEIDSISGSREENDGKSSLYALMAEIDNTESKDKVIVVAATNALDNVDPALLRPGRFTKHFHVDRPDKEGIKKMVHFHLKDIPQTLTADEINQIVTQLDEKKRTQAEIGHFFNEVKRGLVLHSNEGELADMKSFEQILENTNG